MIRNAVPVDFPVLLRIDRSSFEPGIAYKADQLREFMDRPSASTLVAEIGGTIVAFLLMEVHSRQGSATLVTLDVDRDYRRQGIASQLLHKSEHILVASSVGRYRLEVDTHNHPAVRFYGRHGFHALGVLRNYYADGADAYLMLKNLA